MRTPLIEVRFVFIRGNPFEAFMLKGGEVYPEPVEGTPFSRTLRRTQCVASKTLLQFAVGFFRLLQGSNDSRIILQPTPKDLPDLFIASSSITQ